MIELYHKKLTAKIHNAEPMTNSQKIKKLIKEETKRQQTGLVLIASENYASTAVLRAMGTPLSNKYSEGYPGKRYYSGNQFIDQIETMAQNAALSLFKLSPRQWHANVQPHSGSGANLAAYLALLKPGDKILAMDLKAGGHLTHGSHVNLSGQLFKFIHYGVDAQTEKLNYHLIAKIAAQEKPKMIVAGATAYPRQIDFKKIGLIAKKNQAWFLADISHIAGLVTAGLHPSPFPEADVITTTTHKTLRGPRGAIIICRANITKMIDRAVFPGAQGGPLENVIAAKALCFTEAATIKFKKDQKQTIKNARELAKTLKTKNIKLISNGTDNHLLLVDCRPLNISGRQAADILSQAEIYTNANLIPFDSAPAREPSGLRLGTPALTSRGLKEKEMNLIGSWIATILQKPQDQTLIRQIKKAVNQLTKKFPIYKNISFI